MNSSSRFSSLRNCPHHQRLSAAHVSCGKNTWNRRHVVLGGRDVTPRVEFHTKFFDHAIAYRPGETHREQDEIGIHRKFGVRKRLKFRRWADASSVQLFYVSVFVASELCGRYAPLAKPAFFVRTFDPQLHWPQRPGRKWGPLGWRHGHDFK